MAVQLNEFLNNTILFAEPLNNMRLLFADTLSLRASAARQLLLSTGRHSRYRETQRLSKIPTGLAVLHIAADDALTLLTLTQGVADANKFLESKLPVKSWALESASSIPQSALPGPYGYSLASLGGRYG